MTLGHHKRTSNGSIIGQIATTEVPRFAAPGTFGLVPDFREVTRADVGILGVPFDSTVSYRPGARFGPEHIRNSSRLLRPYNPEADKWPFLGQQVADLGDVAFNPYDINKALNSIEYAVAQAMEFAPKNLILGGDHSISLPVLRALAKKHGPVSVIHFDAHLDTWDTYFDQPYLHGTPFRRAAEEGLLDPEGCTHVGTRGGLYGNTDMLEDEALGFMTIRCHELHLDGVQVAIERIKQRVLDRPTYISVDIDVLDPAYAPGTGTPEPGGMASWQLLHIIRSLSGLNIVGGDIMEVAPAYDHAEITGFAAAHVGYELLSAWAPVPSEGEMKTR
jgi:agmatinase